MTAMVTHGELKSKHISPFAKILGLADTYIAMISSRAYLRQYWLSRLGEKFNR